jgi:hypothetical protein
MLVGYFDGRHVCGGAGCNQGIGWREMPQTMHRQRWSTTLVAPTVAFGLLIATAGEARGAPPVDELVWSGENCDSAFPMATLTASGNGRWAVVTIQASTDGGQTFQSLPGSEPRRFEHDIPMTFGWVGDTVFRASDSRNNGSLMGDWVVSEPVDCP